ncbi:MAG TPA: hypothetical protein VN031_01870 [Candidatus Microsaccharimonas sp.]|nr:hypothetical protein [Candidatus Microsaccharimonas sp.]
MTKIISKLRLAATLPLVVGIMGFAPVVVYADHGKAAADTTTTSETETTDPTTGSDDTAAKTEAINTAHSKALELLTEKRATIKQHTTEQKQKACEARATNIDMRANNYATAAQRHLANFTAIFTKVQAFHDKKQLNVTNYDTLVAAANAKQVTAQAAVDALKAVDVKIDCTQADPAIAVANLKTATSNARTALQDYRTAIKDVIIALQGASTANKTSDTSSTGGNQ